MTEIVRKKPDHLVATVVLTDAEIAKELAEAGASFDLVVREIQAIWSDPKHPEANRTKANDIALMRRCFETAPAFYDLEDRANEYLKMKHNG